jgi:hypothetical protein
MVSGNSANGLRMFPKATYIFLVLQSPVLRWQTTSKTEVTEANKKKKGMIPQDKAFAVIKSSAILSLGRIEHSNFSACLENPSLSFKYEL